MLDMVPFGPMEEEVLCAVELCLWQVFGLEVRRCPVRPIPPEAFDTTRAQYGSLPLLARLQRGARAEAHRTLGLTNVDLFIPMLTFVFGQAQVGGRCALVSSARLRQEFYGLEPNASLLTARMVREVVHEVGHTHGLLHCSNPECPMSLSNTIMQVDRKGEDLCQSCWTILEATIAGEEQTMRQ